MGLGLPALILRKKKKSAEQTYRDRNSWTMSVMKSQKTGEDSQNIEDIRYSCWFVVLQHSWPSFLAFEINKSILILNRAKSFLLYNESFTDQVCLVKEAGY